MSFKIIALTNFGKEVKRLSKKYPSLKQDFAKLIRAIESNHRLGTSIGKNCYKIRLQITSKRKGKSGGARVITHLIITLENETLYLVKIYDKAEQESISETELKQLLLSIKH